MAPRAVACVVVVALAGSACGGTTKRTATTASPSEARLTPGLAQALDARVAQRLRRRGHRRRLRGDRVPRRARVELRRRARRRRDEAADDAAHVDAPQQRDQDGHGGAGAALRGGGPPAPRRHDQALVPGVGRRSAGDGARPARPPRRDAGHPATPSTARGQPPARKGVAAPGHRGHPAGRPPHGRGGLLEHGLSDRGTDPPAGGRADRGRGDARRAVRPSGRRGPGLPADRARAPAAGAFVLVSARHRRPSR